MSKAVYRERSRTEIRVRRKGAFDTTIAAARFLQQMGCQIKIVSLMMNRYFAEDADEISRMPLSNWEFKPN